MSRFFPRFSQKERKKERENDRVNPLAIIFPSRRHENPRILNTFIVAPTTESSRWLLRRAGWRIVASCVCVCARSRSLDLSPFKQHAPLHSILHSRVQDVRFKTQSNCRPVINRPYYYAQRSRDFVAQFRKNQWTVDGQGICNRCSRRSSPHLRNYDLTLDRYSWSHRPRSRYFLNGDEKRIIVGKRVSR